MSLALKKESEGVVGINSMFPDALGFCFEIPNHPVQHGYDSETTLRLGLVKLVKNAPWGPTVPPSTSVRKAMSGDIS